MSLATTPDQLALAEAVAGFVRSASDLSSTREAAPALAAGERLASWDQWVAQELHAIHLPTPWGDGASAADLSVVVEELARALFPGPVLSTLMASWLLAEATEPGAEQSRSEALARFAAGATGAVVHGPDLVAVPAGEGWTVSGTSLPAAGLIGADLVLVRARTADDRDLWFLLRPAPTAVVTEHAAVDLTRSMGVLECHAHPVTAEDRLGVAPGSFEYISSTLGAAEASGLCRWFLDTAVEHARTRHQFGNPIGSFQAVQHKLAMMLVGAESVAAVAWDAARAVEDAAAQRSLAATQAAHVAPSMARDLAVECVSVLGAVGFTWEHDAHLYWRRAIANSAIAGPRSLAAGTLARRWLTDQRDFSLAGPQALPELRREVGEVLTQALAAADDDSVMTGWGPVRGGERRRILAEARLVSPHYPPPYGRSADAEEQAVIAQEFAAHGLPQPTTVIGEWALPTLIEHGTDAQRARFVEPTLRGELVWCQLFSEPGAGSDLAALSTRAHRVDGGWVLNGQKVWNSYAHEADWGVCLARTSTEGPRHAGISFFVVDMHAPGVDVRPIRQATGLSEFNEVFLTEVFVPDECLVGAPGDGWRVAGTTLANERVNMGASLTHGSSALVKRALEDGVCAVDPDEALRVLGECVSREMVLQALALRSTRSALAGLDPGPGASVQKVLNALAQRDGSRAALGVLGPQAAIDAADAPYAVDHLGLPAVLFGGGTIEIQLNLIARRVLRLPSGSKPKGDR